MTAIGDHLDIGDTGCFNNSYGVNYPSCLNCPLPFCKYEVPPFQGQARRIRNDSAVLEAMNGVVPDSLPQRRADKLASNLGITSRTVYRALERLRKGESNGIRSNTALG